MTEQQKQNVANILRMAKGYMDKDKKIAVERCDFDTSIRIASNEARLDAYFRKQGVVVPEQPPHP